MIDEKLEDLMRKGDTTEFNRILKTTTDFDPNYLLRQICNSDSVKEETLATFATNLLEKFDAHGIVSPIPIHLAAEKGRAILLATLINHPKHPADVTVVNYYGETAINSAVRGAVERKEKDPKSEENALKCIKLLVDKNCSIHVRDNVSNKFTPVHLAAKNQLWQLVEFFLEQGVNIDVEIGNETARQFIEDFNPEWEKNYKGDTTKGEDSRDVLISQLENNRNTNKEEIFQNWMKDNESSLRVNDPCKGRYTFLECAIKNRLPAMARELIERGANPNPAFILALMAGEQYLDILKESKFKLDIMQLAQGDSKHTVLHKAVLSEKPTVSVIDFLLKEAKRQQIEDFDLWINARDYNGCTALHLASKRHLKDVIATLLRNKANMFVCNNFDLPAFYHIRPEQIEEHLNEQIQLTASLNDENYGVIFDLGFLNIPRGIHKTNEEQKKGGKEIYHPVEKDENKREQFKNETIYPEMEPLIMLAESPIHNSLLQHPVVRVFLQLKWQRLYWFYWLNCIFYLIFVISFFAFVFSIDLKKIDSDGAFNSTSLSDKNDDENLYFKHHHLFQMTTAVLTFFLALRELSQALFLTEKYLLNWENWLEVLIILLTFLLLIAPFSKALASALSLLICLEMFLLMSRYPRLANYIHMFFQVARNFVKFLSWYFLMILAFGFSFYILFPHCKGNPEDGCKIFFNTIPYSIFKTVIMISGEYESGDLKFDHVSIVSHLIFIAFLFFISIVMVNLLNGLAVSDTQQIKNDAELIFCKSQAKFFHDIETTLLMTYREGGRCPAALRSFARWMSKKILLIDNLLAKQENTVTVLLNKNNEVKPDVRLYKDNEICMLFCACKMFPSGVRRICNKYNTIVRDALLIVNKNEERENEVSARLQRLEELVQTLLRQKPANN
ncbi:transient receptor potential cation channel protein painless-like [Cloeon dipterum]|uniref:transient receptor potential cation channel protein painless-like n=1 Tax=Cloeon dipterum TaxID=197152 RepID=UPI0032202260